MISFLRCLFSGHDPLHDRNDHGKLILKCKVCGHEQLILESSVLTSGPAHEPRAVKGRPLISAVTSSAKVKSIKRLA
jgi:hypothetical protein